MLLLLTILTFLTTVLLVVGAAYLLSPAGNAASNRLARLWNLTARKAEGNFQDRQKENAKRTLTKIGQMVPSSQKKLSSTRRLMVRAGYRSTEAVLAFQGVRLLLPSILLAVIFFTGYYREKPLSLVLALMAGVVLPGFWLSRRIRHRQHRIRLGLPDALDLLVVCVEAGLGLDQAIMRVSQELGISHPEVSEEFQLLHFEMRVGKTRIEALRELGVRTGVDDIKALVAMLIQTDRFGTSIAQSLRVHSDELRTKRRQRAEEAAAKTPVKMVPVLVFFIFPALFAVIIGPAVITIVRQLLPMMNK